MFIQGSFRLESLQASDDDRSYGDTPRKWRATFKGELFGHPAWLNVTVEDPSVLGFGAEVKLGLDAKLFSADKEKRDA